MEFRYKGHSRKSGVYKITNITNGKIYIGSAKEFKRRARGHLNSLKNNKHSNKQLQASFNKHGSDAFLFEVLEVVLGEKLARTAREQFYINQELGDWRMCFNVVKKAVKEQGAWSSTPEETRRKLSLAHKGQKAWNKGIPHSAETKRKISEACKRKPPISEETRRKLSAAQKGRKHTEEARKNMAEAQKKKWQDPEYHAKMAAICNTPEYKKKMVVNSNTYWGKIAAMSEADKEVLQQANRKRAHENGQCKTVEQWSRDGKTLIKIWSSLAEAARGVKRVQRAQLADHLKPGSNRKTVGGYTWKHHS